ncbi:hypothetical protein ACIBCB_15545 [Streptomyces uncialis]|uniref:hypothetical protein n=1 Tax=Streptomyces uncialis TaxID=1048205 RepID=UPI0037A1156E
MKAIAAGPRSRRVLDHSLMALGAGALATALGALTLAPVTATASSHRLHTHGHHHPHSHSHRGHEDLSHDSPRRSLGGLLPTRRGPGPTPLQGRTGVAIMTRPDPTRPLAPTTPRRRTPKGGLIGMGIAGGLVPSPSALVVLLGAVALGRTAFGVLLVLAYGLGMAATLTLAGLFLIRLRDRLGAHIRSPSGKRSPPLENLARIGPSATSLLVVLVGLGLTARAATGTG